MLTLRETAKALGVATDTVKDRHQRGIMQGHAYNDKGQRLFEPMDENAPIKGKWKVRRAGNSQNMVR